jgi:hypothetical protein
MINVENEPLLTDVLADRALCRQEEVYTPMPIECHEPSFRSIPLQLFRPTTKLKLERRLLVTTGTTATSLRLLICQLTKVEKLGHAFRQSIEVEDGFVGSGDCVDGKVSRSSTWLCKGQISFKEVIRQGTYFASTVALSLYLKNNVFGDKMTEGRTSDARYWITRVEHIIKRVDSQASEESNSVKLRAVR